MLVQKRQSTAALLNTWLPRGGHFLRNTSHPYLQRPARKSFRSRLVRRRMMSIILILKISRHDGSCSHGAMLPCLLQRSEDASAQRGGYSAL